jgi:hypothetical protein
MLEHYVPRMADPMLPVTVYQADETMPSRSVLATKKVEWTPTRPHA